MKTPNLMNGSPKSCWGCEKVFLIRADRNVRYEFLKQVMIVAGKAGVGKVTFSVVDQDPTPAPR